MSFTCLRTCLDLSQVLLCWPAGRRGQATWVRLSRADQHRRVFNSRWRDGAAVVTQHGKLALTPGPSGAAAMAAGDERSFRLAGWGMFEY